MKLGHYKAYLLPIVIIFVGMNLLFSPQHGTFCKALVKKKKKREKIVTKQSV
jgi:hypothetical protein